MRKPVKRSQRTLPRRHGPGMTEAEFEAALAEGAGVFWEIEEIDGQQCIRPFSPREIAANLGITLSQFLAAAPWMAE